MNVCREKEDLKAKVKVGDDIGLDNILGSKSLGLFVDNEVGLPNRCFYLKKKFSSSLNLEIGPQSNPLVISYFIFYFYFNLG